MRLLNIAGCLDKHFDKSAVTIGNFDGVHRGHCEIFRRLKLQATLRGLPAVVVTFEPHPLAVLAPGLAPALITTSAQKTELIAAAGIDYLAVLEFTFEFSKISAELFVRDLLIGSLGMQHIIIGHDYAFGRDRQGNFEMLSRLGGELGFSLEDLEPVGDGETIFSSSLVRRRVCEGDMPGAAAILGRYHTISGRVIHGREVGASLGFPTANIETANELIPPDGVYAVLVSISGKLIKGACSIGINPTFGGKERAIEVFIFDFSEQLYGRELSVSFVQRLRDVRRFPDADSLIRAITADVSAARTLLDSVHMDMIKPLLPRQPDSL